jgi:hypothetical protein
MSYWFAEPHTLVLYRSQIGLIESEPGKRYLGGGDDAVAHSK